MSDGPPTRHQQVVQAAIGVFLRYGYARTTMGDIAQAAGLSRPGLYLIFPNKDRIFRAVIEAMIADKLREIREGLAERTDLADRLHFACEAWGAAGFDLVKAHPDAKDVFDLGFGVVCESYAAFEALLVEIVREPVSVAGLTLAPEELAHVIVSAIKGFKDMARDGAEVRRMIAAQVAVVAAALRPLSQEPKPARKARRKGSA